MVHSDRPTGQISNPKYMCVSWTCVAATQPYVLSLITLTLNKELIHTELQSHIHASDCSRGLAHLAYHVHKSGHKTSTIIISSMGLIGQICANVSVIKLCPLSIHYVSDCNEV